MKEKRKKKNEEALNWLFYTKFLILFHPFFILKKNKLYSLKCLNLTVVNHNAIFYYHFFFNS